MRITFSVPKKQLKSDLYARMCGVIAAAVPDARVECDTAKGLLFVELPPEADPIAAAETLRLALLKAGVTATRVPDPQQNAPYPPQGGYGYPPMQPKRHTTVRLSTFIVSLVAVFIVASVLMFSVGALFGGNTLRLGTNGTLGTGEQKGESYADKIALVDYLFENYSLYDTDGQLLLDEMLKAYAAATGDKYAAYYTAEEFEAMMNEMAGSAVGIGVTITEDAENSGIVIIGVAPDSPAAAAGVLPGDRIVRIGTIAEGENVSDLGYDLAVSKMRGEEGSVARFVVRRGSEELEFSVTRAPFVAVSASGRVSESDPAVGIVRITGFEANTPAQFKSAMSELISVGCTRFVFDVRNNPGGEQKSVTAVLSYFANEKDTVLSVVSKDGTTTYYYAEAASYTGDYEACSVKKEEIGMYRGYPVVVLANGFTASAGELFTAGLRDYGVATVVGETTYGKGVIQRIYDLSAQGFSGGIKLTVGYYAPPSGVNYDGVGIVPDTSVAPDPEIAHKNAYLLTESEDNQLRAAIAAVLAK